MPTVAVNFGPRASGTSTRTLVQIVAAANRPCKILEVGITFAGTDNVGAPIETQLLRQANTPSGPAAVAEAHGQEDASYAEGLTHFEDFTDEPTPGDVLRRWFVHPQTGLIYTNPWPSRLIVPQASIIALRVISPAVTVNIVGYIVVEE